MGGGVIVPRLSLFYIIAENTAQSHSVYELLRPSLEAIDLEAALDPLIGAHNGLVVFSPAFLQRPSAGFTWLPVTQVLHRSNSKVNALSLQKLWPREAIFQRNYGEKCSWVCVCVLCECVCVCDNKCHRVCVEVQADCCSTQRIRGKCDNTHAVSKAWWESVCHFYVLPVQLNQYTHVHVCGMFVCMPLCTQDCELTFLTKGLQAVKKCKTLEEREWREAEAWECWWFMLF